jgi:hypothetical protein
MSDKLKLKIQHMLKTLKPIETVTTASNNK